MRALRVAGLAGLLVMTGAATISADGTEQLGTPSIAIASGTGVASGGTGMVIQPGSVSVEVPAGATVNQVLLYWEGFMSTWSVGDDTIVVDGTEVTGTLVGGPTFFFDAAYASTFRADITDLGLVGDGTTTLGLSGLDFTSVANGAGVVVIYDDGSSDAAIDLRDGTDLAYGGFPDPLRTTVAQTFDFAASTADRTASLDMFFASVSGQVSGGGLRPTTIALTTSDGADSNTTYLDNVLDSNEGEEFDNFRITVAIPAGATSLTVHPTSEDRLGTGLQPASFDWLAAAFSLEPEVPQLVPGRMTGGGSVFTIDGARVTRGFQIHCDLREPNNLEVNWPGGNRFHLTELTSAVCTDSPVIDQLPRSAPFDTFKGTGVGRYKGDDGATIEFEFTDAGEPGVNDTASITVKDSDGNVVLDVPGGPLPGFLDRGNIQAHKDNQSTL